MNEEPKRIKISLLKEILNKLIELDGLNAYDKNGEHVIRDVRINVVPTDDITEIDNKRLIKLLENVLGYKNVHFDCEWYDVNTDDCLNYAMGIYCGLAFDVSRHDKCIKDMVEKNDSKTII